MRVVFVLGSLNLMAAWQLVGLQADCIYHFSAREITLSEFPVPCYRLANPQLDALQESAIVESCIERNISQVARAGGDATLMRRALRLSELRVEAKCYLNALECIQQRLMPAGGAIESVTFVSHYLLPADVPPFLDLRCDWHQVPHTRFWALIPGLSRLVFLFQLVGARKVGDQENPLP